MFKGDLSWKAEAKSSTCQALEPARLWNFMNVVFKLGLQACFAFDLSIESGRPGGLTCGLLPVF